MSAIFFKHKRQRKTPTAVFSLKDEKEVIIKLRSTYETIPFECIGRSKYSISMERIEEAVQHCMDIGLMIECIPEQVERAMSYSPNLPFDESFKETEIYKNRNK